MTDPAPIEQAAPRWLAPLLLCLASLSMLPGAWWAAFHCDEFVVLDHVSDFARGNFAGSGRPGLLWMVLVPLTWLGDPVVIAQAARFTALAASVGTLVGLWHLAERAGRVDGSDESEMTAAARWPWFGMAAVLLLVTTMDWQAHSFEVRTDTYAVPLTFAVMALLWRAEVSLKSAVAIGILVAATGLISQKSVYNAAGLGLGWLGMVAMLAWSGRLQLKRQLVAAAAAVTTALVFVALWYGLMALLQADTEFVAKQMSAATRTAFKESTPMRNKLHALGLGIGMGPVLWGMAAPGALWSIWRARRRPGYLAALLLALAMVGTIYVHRGYFMYYIASFEPYVALVAAVALGSMCRALHARVGLWAALLLLGALVFGQGLRSSQPFHAMLATSNQPQYEVIEAAREAFPESVPYWDAIGLVSGYKETTFFGTALGRRWFRQAGGNQAFIKRARLNKPHFYIRNYMTRRRYLRPTERHWLWTHYLPYRSNLYLHGGRMRVTDTLQEQSFESLVSGEYTVYFRGGWTGEAWLDGEPVQHGQIVSLQEGAHRLKAASDGRNGAQLWVILGRDRKPAAEFAAQQVDYSMFPLLTRKRYQQYDDKNNERSDLRTPDHDPVIARVNARKRLERHKRWQRKVDRKDGRP